MDKTEEQILPKCFGGIDKEYSYHCSARCPFTKECSIGAFRGRNGTQAEI